MNHCHHTPGHNVSLLSKFPPSPPPISVWPRQTPQKHLATAPPPPPWMYCNGDMDTLSKYSDNPRSRKNYDLSGSRNNPREVPSASMQEMKGLRWAPVPAELNESEYNDCRNPGYSPQFFSVRIDRISSCITMDMGYPWVTPYFLSSSYCSTSPGQWVSSSTLHL